MPGHQAEEEIEQLILLTERLTVRIRQDTASFEARRPHEAAGRMEETARLANLYRRESERVRQNPGLIAAAPREARARLVRASASFEEALTQHGRSLHGVKTVTEGVVRAIAEEVAKARSARQGYGPGARPPTASATAITLNRRA